MKAFDGLHLPFTQALKGGGFASFFAGKFDKYEKAVEFFEKAGNAFKTAKCWAEAADAFSQAAECYKQLEQPGDAAKKLTEVREAHRSTRRVFHLHCSFAAAVRLLPVPMRRRQSAGAISAP